MSGSATETRAGGRPGFFLRRLWADPHGVSAIAPSSRWLARAMVADLEFRDGDIVVEYGPGTGPITAELAPKIGPGVRYLGIERDPGFHALLRERFPADEYPRMEFVHGDVTDVTELLRERGLDHADAVVSGLPLGSMPEDEVREILTRTADLLGPGGRYRSFSYIHFAVLPGGRRLRRLVRQSFDSSDFGRPVFLNLPPGYVLSGRKNAEA